MTDVEFKERFDSLGESCGRATRCISEWHKFVAGKVKSRPTTVLRHLFRPGSIIVKDVLYLITKSCADKTEKNKVKGRIKAIFDLIKPVVSSLEGFITVPTVRVTTDVEVVRGLFSLIHDRLVEEVVDGASETDLKIPQNTGDHKSYKIEIKKLAHRLAEAMRTNPKLPTICQYPQARNYIIGCTRGKLYFTQCKVIQEAMEAYGWSAESMLTYCKGGSTYDKKTNDKRQTKISKKKRRVTKDLKGAWPDGVS